MNNEIHRLIRAAIKEGDLTGISKLLDGNPEAIRMDTPFGSWLHVAASFGHLHIVEVLIEKYGLDFNQRGGTANSTPLHRAAADGFYDIVEFLLKKGAMIDVSAVERNPLFAAVGSASLEIGKLLIDHGIDTTIKYNGRAAIDLAKDRGANDFVELLSKQERKC